MRKMIYIIMGLLFVNVSCSEDTKIGLPVEIITDYVLPQGDASDEANARIQEIYDTYGSYVLYNYTQKDALWKQAAGTSAVQKYVIQMGDVQYVDKMLDFIDDIWLQFFPNEFLKKGGFPYRVFLADVIYQDKSTEWTPNRYIYSNQMLNDNSLSIAGMNEELAAMDATTKKARQAELINTMWNYYLAEGFLDVPDEFYEGTDYTTTPDSLPSVSADQLEKYRKRGFIPRSYSTAGVAVEWYSYAEAWNYAKTRDLESYMYHLFNRTREQMAIYLDNPEYELIQNKWNVLIDYYKDKYGIDVWKIGNTTYK